MSKKIFHGFLTRTLCFGLVAVGLTGCAQYHVRSNKEPDYTARIERMFVWSAIGEVDYFSQKSEGSNSFEENFHAALKAAFSDAGVKADVRRFSRHDTPAQLSSYETEIAPTARLLIAPKSWYKRGFAISWISLDMSLYDLRSNRRVWRSEVVVDSNQEGPVFLWTANGAKKLSEHIVAALRKDDLIAPATSRPDVSKSPQ